jgi:hypothetical protein
MFRHATEHFDEWIKGTGDNLLRGGGHVTAGYAYA